MDSNQCGPSNAAKDFSRLTLQDRSRYQDRVIQNPGSNAQSFRTSAGKGAQAIEEFARFQAAQDRLLAAYQPQHPHLPMTNAQHSASFQQTSASGFQRPQPVVGAGPATHAAAEFNVRQPNLHARPANAAVQLGVAQQNPQPVAQTFQHFGPVPAAGFGRGGFGAYPQHNFGAPAPVQANPTMFHYAWAGPRPVLTGQQAFEARAKQREFDEEFQRAMNDWARENAAVTGGDQMQSMQPSAQNASSAQAQTSQPSLDNKTAQDQHAETHQLDAQDTASREVQELGERYMTPDMTSVASMAGLASPGMTGSDSGSDAGSELARVAQEVINSVANNESPKFKSSAFFGLMRDIASKEMVLKGTKFVRQEASPGSAAGFGTHLTGSTSGVRQDSMDSGNPAAASVAAYSRAPAVSAKGDIKGKGKAASVEDASDF
ncbi:hypothetical protein DL766_003269 [Monosporascus sp. MC13-8B]|uniref:Peroxin-14 n=1 Tax=Monosporascus cannonballus TaxID=155416 RepID=A0ABY0H106_9PEZI|nr:hypothetical protein DL762_008335 [Monosporascus cannonballus]RYP33776.1 hypothetical protein DL766_003269 [Monosporascus sp. MC13-8B]